MLLQSLLLIVTLAVIGSAILTSTLVSAKSAFHSVIMRESESAMTDATALFVSWAQNNIRQNGIDQLPVWAATAPALGAAPACGHNFSPASSNNSDGCNFYRSITWSVTGYTNVESIASAKGLASEAKNLATAQSEQRLSATLNVSVTDRSGSIIYARESRELTARIFHASPYITVNAERDSNSEAGSISSSEGDTGGYTVQNNHLTTTTVKPNLTIPASYTNTTLLTTIDCRNTDTNSSNNALFDNNNVIFAPLRVFGNLAWAYEIPCKPMQHVNPTTAPSNYIAPLNSMYGNTTTKNTLWLKKDENGSSFAR